MAVALSVFPNPPESVFDNSRRLADVMERAVTESTNRNLPDRSRERAEDLVKGPRNHGVEMPRLRATAKLGASSICVSSRASEPARAGRKLLMRSPAGRRHDAQRKFRRSGHGGVRRHIRRSGRPVSPPRSSGPIFEVPHNCGSTHSGFRSVRQKLITTLLCPERLSSSALPT